jgi:hypothetical protein
MNNGESLTQAITRITGGTIDGVTVPGVMQTTKRKAGALASTAMSAVTNQAALQSYQANNDVIKAVTQLSTLDNRTSDICIAYSGQTWDINTLQPVMGSFLPYNGGPPRHFNCRSRLSPVTYSFKELGMDAEEIPAGTRASMDGQVPADITFNQFLRSKPQSFADDLLGPRRAELWRNGDINLTQLVDMRGNPMTIAQLEAKAGIKPQPRPTIRPQPKQPPKKKTVDSFLENDDGTFVQITQAEYNEIRGHAKRLVDEAKEADDVVTQQIMDLSDDVKAKFPSAVIDDVDVPNGSLEFRIKDLDSTSRKIQTYARDRNISYTEAADQISDSLRYTYVVDEDDYISAVQNVMKRFSEMGYRNGKFDPAWLTRPDYKGLNINMISPQGVRMELQIHTARSFEVKQNINHTLYEKFRKLSKAKQKGPEGQAIQAEMLANAESIPVPRNINMLDNLKSRYNNPSPAAQRQLLWDAEQRIKRREADIRRAAAREAKKKERERLAAAKKEVERKARLREQEAQKLAQRDPPKSPEGQPVIEGSVDATGKLARKFLEKNGYTNKFIDEWLPIIDVMPNWNPTVAKTLLDNAENTLKQVLARDARLKDKLLKSKGDDTVRTTPEFNTLKEAKEWYEDNLISPTSEFAGNTVGTSRFTGDKAAYKIYGNVTLMMRDRFGLPLPQYMGMRPGHNFKFDQSSANAAVHMDSDSFLIVARGMNLQDRLEQSWLQYLRYHGAPDGWDGQVGTKRWRSSYKGNRDATRARIQEQIDQATDKDLIKALKATLKDDDWGHSMGGMVRDGQYQYWRTAVHESGHRVHGNNLVEVNALLRKIRSEGNYKGWIQATSRYAGKNEREFFAEQFTTYVMGKHDRVHPLLRDFFKRLDEGGDFGDDLFKKQQ